MGKSRRVDSNNEGSYYINLANQLEKFVENEYTTSRIINTSDGNIC